MGVLRSLMAQVRDDNNEECWNDKDLQRPGTKSRFQRGKIFEGVLTRGYQKHTSLDFCSETVGSLFATTERFKTWKSGKTLPVMQPSI